METNQQDSDTRSSGKAGMVEQNLVLEKTVRSEKAHMRNSEPNSWKHMSWREKYGKILAPISTTNYQNYDH